ncbi:DUF4347 domain-containing protein [Waterburya agarophytonicola K14]|uniref:DUF4347 domain-containing protein n=1 Tax=Waterburya agarophytonicola KI4 TaxID=2874699 RepID=A0A964BQU2_9CYAN|nr:NF038122 family metalloprotease [Waterburya agarophytonicola]MCC0177780.1 DUF4347 domain-containing protein [Waterburya agarophytonicola KI4]
MVSLASNEVNWQADQDISATSLIFIDTNLSNYQSLIPDGNENQVILIDSQQNGIEQITNVLEQYSNLASISIFSHGDEATIQLGDAYLSTANLDSYQTDLAAWGDALSPEGDLLLYGCNVGANNAGFDFINQVSSLTGADVAASDDLTGNFDLGGDWTLEVVTGNIETPTFIVTEYGSLLDLKFNFTYDTNVTTAQKTAFEYAGKAWSNVLSDNVTVNLHVSMVNNSDLPSNTLGGAVPFFHQGTSYTNFRNKLQSDIKSSDDTTAVNNLENASQYPVRMLTEAPDSITSNTGTLVGMTSYNLNQVAMTRANAKSLGLINANDSTLDGIIVMNNLVGTNVGWQYNYFNSLGSNQIDFTTVAIHEIGHTLGFVSLVDGITNENYQNREMLNSSATSLDLYRIQNRDYSHLSPSFRTRMESRPHRFIGTLDSNFSLDNNKTSIAKFSIGSEDIGIKTFGGTYDPNYYSDSYQGSHWRNQDNAGIMDPLLELGVRRGIAEVDLRALDVIGWDRKSASSSSSNLWSQAQTEANATGNINRNVEVGQMLKDWRWARRGSSNRLRQEGNIAQLLAQEGFFSVGAFRESFDFSTVNSPTESNYRTIVDNSSHVPVWEFNYDSNVEDSEPNSSSIEIQNIATENEGLDYEQMLAIITEELSEDELSQLSLEDLSKLIEQQLAGSLV